MSALQNGCPKCGHNIHCWRCSSVYCTCFVDTKEFQNNTKVTEGISRGDNT